MKIGKIKNLIYKKYFIIVTLSTYGTWYCNDYVNVVRLIDTFIILWSR